MTDQDFLDSIAEADEGEKATGGELKARGQLGRRLAAYQGTLAGLEEEAATIKKEINAIALDQLPKMLHDVGLKSFELSDGRTVKLHTDLKASLPKARAGEVMGYIREHGGSDIIKNVITVEVDRGKDNAAASILHEAEKLGLAASRNETVAPQTYLKWVKDRVKDNKPTDLALLGAFQFERAELK